VLSELFNFLLPSLSCSCRHLILQLCWGSPVPWQMFPHPLPGEVDMSHAGAATGHWGQCRAADVRVRGGRLGGAVRCTRGEGGFPGGDFLPASTGWIAMVIKLFPGMIPQGPAARVLPGMRPGSAGFASHRDGPASSTSLPAHGPAAPDPPSLP